MSSQKNGSTTGADGSVRRFAFVFPMASGHINPSLPIARTLVQQGHQVHYLCREQMREAIEDTGATFHSEITELTEMYEGREPSLFGALTDVQKEQGLENDSVIQAMFKLKEIMLELMLPGSIRWLQKVQAEVVVCCPLMNLDAVYAAKVLGIPCAGVLTTAGPGSVPPSMTEFLAVCGMTPETVLEERMRYQPLEDCLLRLESNYGIQLGIDDAFRPMGKLDSVVESALTLVTTGEFLADPTPPELAQVYEAAGADIVYVGPLLDKEGATRAAGHKFDHHADEADKTEAHRQAEDPLIALKAAKAAGRKVIFASMGTVVTGDSPDFGWASRLPVDGKPKGLSGKELCQAAWSAVFDAFGSKASDEGPLLLVALGPQADALDSLQPPPNAFCLPVMPQVDLLKAGVDLFMTHGGQNSFTEALSAGVPVVVCPGFGDQPVNARKAAALGVGLQMERPMPELEHVAEAVAKYRSDTAAALQEVFANPDFKAESARCAASLRLAGGVPRAAKLILDLASKTPVKPGSSALPRLLGQAGQDFVEVKGVADCTAVDGTVAAAGA